MDYLLIFIAILVALYLLITKVIVPIAPYAMRIVAVICLVTLAVATLLGLTHGLMVSIGSYYRTLCDVYGRKIGIVIGASVTLAMIALCVFLLRAPIMNLINQTF